MEFNQDMLAQFGIMNKLSTGNMMLDVLLCMMVPAIMAHLSQHFEAVREWLKQLLSKGPTTKFSRSIEYATAEGYYWYDEDNSRNKVLQDAVLMYLDTLPKIVEQFQEAKYKLIKGAKPVEDKDDKCGGDSDSDSECDYRSDEIRRYKVQIMPPENIEIEVEQDIFFVMNRRKEDADEKKTKWVVSLTFSSDLKDGQTRIDKFVDKALDHYKMLEGQKKDETRYLYTPLFTSAGGNNEESGGATDMLFKRYGLSDEKTFQSFFHPEKDVLLRLMDHFMNKSGKFAIPGYPHKLGLLLHGPPGTGKTSLIKALAHYTKRHIVSIPLSRVKTNQQLTDLVFDQACRVEGDDWTYKLPFKKTIFVMEDVDAAADVVHKRDESDFAIPLSMLMGEKSSKEKSKDKDTADKQADAETGVEEGPMVKMPGFGSAGMSKWLQAADDLNLAGILNVLDGVVDCPNRIIIMTTNHPEKLDPALIRPGRINKKMYLGLLQRKEGLQMLQQYYGKLSQEDEDRFTVMFPDEQVSPAALETLCADCDTMQELFEGLDELTKKLASEEEKN